MYDYRVYLLHVSKYAIVFGSRGKMGGKRGKKEENIPSDLLDRNNAT